MSKKKKAQVTPIQELASLIFDFCIVKLKREDNVYTDSDIEFANDWGLFSGLTIDSTNLCVAIYNHDTDLVKKVVGICMEHDALGVTDPSQWIDSFYDETHPYHFWFNGRNIAELNDERIRQARTIQCLYFYVTLILDGCVCEDGFDFKDDLVNLGWIELSVDGDVYRQQRMVLCTEEQGRAYLDKASAWMDKQYCSGRAMFSSTTSTARSAYAEALANADGKTLFMHHALQIAGIEL